jgi:hypothetical protein
MSKSPEERTIALRVKVLWSSVLVLVALYLLYKIDNGKEIAGNLVTLAAGAIAGYVAYKAVEISKDTLAEKVRGEQDELRRRRPYFTFLDGSMSYSGPVTEEISASIAVTFKNAGIHSARSVTVIARFITDYIDDTPSGICTVTREYVNDTPGGIELYFGSGNAPDFDPPDTTTYVGPLFTYVDVVTAESFSQRFYYALSQHTRHGDGLGEYPLYSINIQDKPRIDGVLDGA